MTNDGSFWKPEFKREIETQEELLKHFEKSNHLKSTKYLADTLGPKEEERGLRIQGKTFETVSFSRTHISGIVFRNCHFEDCQFQYATITACEFHNCKFVSTNTNKIQISKTLINPRSFKKCIDPKKYQNVGVHLYQKLLHNSREADQSEYTRDAQFLFLQWKRRQDAYEIGKYGRPFKNREEFSRWIRKCSRFLWRLVWEIFFGWGIRLKRFSCTLAVVLLGAWSLNFFCRETFGLCRGGEPIATHWDALYFTAISLTTLGYGDIVPTTTAGQLWASAQTFIGFLLLALLVSAIFRRISTG